MATLKSLLRWSLRTQLIAVLFAGYLFLLWHWGESWVQVRKLSREDLFKNYQLQYSLPRTPDGTRRLQQTVQMLQMLDERNKILWEKQFNTHIADPAFINDNEFTLFVMIKEPNGYYDRHYVIFRRRFPEWWWGHFYRPEVWLLPLWLALIVWTIRKDRREVRA